MILGFVVDITSEIKAEFGWNYNVTDTQLRLPKSLYFKMTIPLWKSCPWLEYNPSFLPFRGRSFQSEWSWTPPETIITRVMYGGSSSSQWVPDWMCSGVHWEQFDKIKLFQFIVNCSWCQSESYRENILNLSETTPMDRNYWTSFFPIKKLVYDQITIMEQANKALATIPVEILSKLAFVNCHNI